LIDLEGTFDGVLEASDGNFEDGSSLTTSNSARPERGGDFQAYDQIPTEWKCRRMSEKSFGSGADGKLMD